MSSRPQPPDRHDMDHELRVLRDNFSELPVGVIANFEGVFTLLRAEFEASGVTFDNSAIKAAIIGAAIAEADKARELATEIGVTPATLLTMILHVGLDLEDRDDDA